MIYFSGKVASWNLLTDRNYRRIQVSSNIGVSLFVTYGVGGIFEWGVSSIPGKSCGIDIDKHSPWNQCTSGVAPSATGWCGITIGWVPEFLVFVAETEERLVGSGAWTVGWSIIGGHELHWFCGYLLFVTVAIVYWLQTREGSKMMICYYTSIIFLNLMDGWMPFFASGKF